MPFPRTPPDIDDTRLSILDHLEELRGRLLKSLACVAILFPLCWYVCADVLQWFLEVVCVDLPKVQTLQVMELFFTEMKLSFFMAIVLAYPFLAFQIWRFVAPGLYRHERHYVARFVLASTALFVVGAEFALLYVFPRVVQFGASLATGKIEMTPQLSSVINLASMLMLGFGVMFQLPIVVYLLAVTGLVSVATMRKTRPLIIIVIFALAAILTPTPDIVTQCALAVPSWLLFEVSLIFTDVAVRRKRRREQVEEERQSDDAPETADPGPPPALPPPPSPPPPAAALPVGSVAGSGDAIVPDAAPPPASQTSWERWYGNVSAESTAEQKPASPPPAAPPTLASPAPTASAAAAAPSDDGPVGSGQVLTVAPRRSAVYIPRVQHRQPRPLRRRRSGPRPPFAGAAAQRTKARAAPEGGSP